MDIIQEIVGRKGSFREKDQDVRIDFMRPVEALVVMEVLTMKLEYSRSRPSHLVENWPGQFDLFSWIEFVALMPQPIYIITTRKENGMSNACLHAWGHFTGEGEKYMCIFSIGREGHTYHNIMRDKEWCVNVPDLRFRPESFRTIEARGEVDEIAEAGLTAEQAMTVSVPRIAECFLNLECTLEWERELYEGSRTSILAGVVQHVALDEALASMSAEERFRSYPLMYNVHEPIDLVAGKSRESRIGKLSIVEEL